MENRVIASASDPPAIEVVVRSEIAEVRGALADVLARLRDLDLGSENMARIELVLAEVLNNVIEHAYSLRATGEIEAWLQPTQDRLLCRITDSGWAMPRGMAPEGDLPDLEVPMGDIPEGGFGWFLIRELTADLRYRRLSGRNRLEFSIPFEIV